MTIEELVEAACADSIEIARRYGLPEELIHGPMRRNAVRLTAINGIMDGRYTEVTEYLSGLGDGELTELLEMIRNEDDDDPEWTEACRKLAEGIAGILDAKQEFYEETYGIGVRRKKENDAGEE